MKADFKNSVIIIGGDHHNTLAVARCLGKKKCEQRLLIHTAHETLSKLHISESRYARGRTYCVAESENAIIEWLLAHVTDKKQILFPCSDLAAYTIDIHYEKLCKYYLIPGFKNAPGRVCALMDKWTQKRFAEEHRFPMAKTWRLMRASGFSVPMDITYPCIIKPEISAFGSKGDIAICDDQAQLQSALERLTQAGYESLIVQQFLLKEYEVCAYGCLVDDKALCAGGTIRKIREYPPRGGGSLTLAQFIDEPSVNALRDRVLDTLYKEGYRGQYDVEFFVCQDGVYLNEINFRHSGNGYALVKNGVPAPYIWCASVAGLDVKAKTAVKTGKYHMDELSDLHHVAEKRLSPIRWMLDCMKTSAFSKWDVADLKGTMAYYRPFAKALFRKIFR